jgi:hypothetical protein
VGPSDGPIPYANHVIKIIEEKLNPSIKREMGNSIYALEGY